MVFQSSEYRWFSLLGFNTLKLLCLDYSGLFIEAYFISKLYFITAQKSFTARSNDRVRGLGGLKSDI